MSKIIVPVNNLGQFGVIKALKPEEMPLNAWSDVKNFRFLNGYAERTAGREAALAVPPVVAPYHVRYALSPTVNFWVYLGLLKAYAYDGVAHFDITRTVGGDYNATTDDKWVSTVLGGVPIFTNPNDIPQMWLPQNTSTPLAPLTNWDVTWLAKTVRAYKQFLVALFVTKGAIEYPNMIKWSHGAAPGAVPSSWDETDATKDAGEYELADTVDRLVDCVSMRDLNVVYKENTSWGMQFIGGPAVFRFYKIFESIGALSRECAAEYFSGFHALFGDSDIISHNGQNATSILSRRMRRWLYARIDADNYLTSFVVTNFIKREVWFCFPEIGQILPNMAVVWNFDENTVGLHEIPNVAHMSVGATNEGSGGDTWSGDPNVWAVDATTWADRVFNPSERAVFAANPGDTLLEHMDYGLQFNGSNFTSHLERQGLAVPLRANAPPDYTLMKFWTRIWPRIEAPSGTVVNVYAKGQKEITEPVTYGAAKTFVVGTDKFVDIRESGRTLSVKFEVTSAADVKVHGYELELNRAGRGY